MSRGWYEQDWPAVPNMFHMKVTSWRYMLLSKLTTGKTRKKYKEKRMNLYRRIDEIEAFYFKNREHRVPFNWLFLKKHLARMIEPPMDGINRNEREQKIIVSLTTYPNLIHYRINVRSFIVGNPITPYKLDGNFRSYDKIRELTKHIARRV